jgi:uncharacterized protein
MKKIFLAALVFLFSSQLLLAQKENAARAPEPQIRQYWFVLLTAGPNRSQDSATAAQLQIGHLNNIRRLYNEGKIKVAGPFGEDGDPLFAGWQGLFIFDCPTKEEVEKLLQTDPSIAAGRMVYQVKSWYTVPTGSFVPGKPAKPLF